MPKDFAQTSHALPLKLVLLLGGVGDGIQPWWYTSVIPTLGKVWQEDHELKASLGYTVRLCLKKLLNIH
jgi:hypothetical protein